MAYSDMADLSLAAVGNSEPRSPQRSADQASYFLFADLEELHWGLKRLIHDSNNYAELGT